MPVRAKWNPQPHPHQQQKSPNNAENNGKGQHGRDQRAHPALRGDVFHEGQHDHHIRVERRDAVGHRVSDAVGALGQLRRNADHHEHGDKDRREHGVLG